MADLAESTALTHTTQDELLEFIEAMRAIRREFLKPADIVLEDDRVTWHRVPYDFRSTMRKIFDQPELSDLLGRRLEIGK